MSNATEATARVAKRLKNGMAWVSRADAEAIIAENRRLDESASAGWECLDMVREVLAVHLGEEAMKATPPMFYPEAIRSLMYRVACGKIPETSYPPESLLFALRDAEAQLAAIKATLAVSAVPSLGGAEGGVE